MSHRLPLARVDQFLVKRWEKEDIVRPKKDLRFTASPTPVALLVVALWALPAAADSAT